MAWIPLEKKMRTSNKNVDGRSTSSREDKKLRTRSMEKQGGMVFGFRKTAIAVIKPERVIYKKEYVKQNSVGKHLVKRRFDNKTHTYTHGIYDDVSINSSNYTESCQKFCASNGPYRIDMLATLIFICCSISLFHV
jgi:hypothetical protein